MTFCNASLTTRFTAPVLAFALIAALSVAGAPRAAGADEEGVFEIRLHALQVSPANLSAPIAALGVPKNAVTTNPKLIPEFELVYHARAHFAAELIGAWMQKQKAFLAGQQLGSFQYLPPTFMLQYQLAPFAAIRPYVGVGINHTLINAVNIAAPGVGSLTLNSSSTGPAIQFGADYRIGPREFLNVDVKQVWIRSPVYADGMNVTTVYINPLLVGVGLSYRF